MSDTPERKRFIVVETNDCALRDCATGQNYHLQTREETAALAHLFNLAYSHSAELEVKCKAMELANAELRNIQESYRAEIDELHEKLRDYQ